MSSLSKLKIRYWTKCQPIPTSFQPSLFSRNQRFQPPKTLWYPEFGLIEWTWDIDSVYELTMNLRYLPYWSAFQCQKNLWHQYVIWIQDHVDIRAQYERDFKAYYNVLLTQIICDTVKKMLIRCAGSKSYSPFYTNAPTRIRVWETHTIIAIHHSKILQTWTSGYNFMTSLIIWCLCSLNVERSIHETDDCPILFFM